VDPVPDPLLLRKSGSAGNGTRDLWICSQELRPLDHGGGPAHKIKKLKKCGQCPTKGYRAIIIVIIIIIINLSIDSSGYII
jgi:hypothetical protein